MLNQQLNLDKPYDPTPFKDADLEKHGDIPETDDFHDMVGVLRGSKRLSRMARFQRKILYKGYVPLVLRFISLFFAVTALILAGFITKYSYLANIQARPSTGMAFAVNIIALVYLPWVAKVYPFLYFLSEG